MKRIFLAVLFLDSAVRAEYVAQNENRVASLVPGGMLDSCTDLQRIER